MKFRHCFALLMCICCIDAFAQYEGLDSNRRQMKDIQPIKDDYRDRKAYSDYSIHGIDVMIDPISYSLTLEAVYLGGFILELMKFIQPMG